MFNFNTANNFLKTSGLAGKSKSDAAKCDMFAEGALDLFPKLQKEVFIKDPAERVNSIILTTFFAENRIKLLLI